MEADDKFQSSRALNGILDWPSNQKLKTTKLKIILDNEMKFTKNGFLEALAALYNFNFE